MRGSVWGDFEVANGKALALKVDRLTRPGAPQNFDPLLHEAGAMGDFATKLIKFQLPVADADTQIKTATGNQRQGRCVFSHSHGISQW